MSNSTQWDPIILQGLNGLPPHSITKAWVRRKLKPESLDDISTAPFIQAIHKTNPDVQLDKNFFISLENLLQKSAIDNNQTQYYQQWLENLKTLFFCNRLMNQQTSAYRKFLHNSLDSYQHFKCWSEPVRKELATELENLHQKEARLNPLLLFKTALFAASIAATAALLTLAIAGATPLFFAPLVLMGAGAFLLGVAPLLAELWQRKMTKDHIDELAPLEKAYTDCDLIQRYADKNPPLNINEDAIRTARLIESYTCLSDKLAPKQFAMSNALMKSEHHNAECMREEYKSLTHTRAEAWQTLQKLGAPKVSTTGLFRQKPDSDANKNDKGLSPSCGLFTAAIRSARAARIPKTHRGVSGNDKETECVITSPEARKP